MATSWSYSKLGDFEKCKKYFWLKHDQKIPEPVRPLPPGKTEHANDRGTRIHTSCELFINGTNSELCPEADKHFGNQIALLREMHKDGLVSLEGEWGMNADWAPCGWSGDWVEYQDVSELGLSTKKVKALPDRPEYDTVFQVSKKFFIYEPAWLRLKLDAMVMHDERTATVIDFKTGRKFGNEIKHAEQLQLYQLVTFLRYPQLETVHAELWYLDQDETTSQKFTRSAGLRYKDKFGKRGNAVISATEFPANPNKFTCKWCMYGPWGSGDCTVGVK